MHRVEMNMLYEKDTLELVMERVDDGDVYEVLRQGERVAVILPYHMHQAMLEAYNKANLT